MPKFGQTPKRRGKWSRKEEKAAKTMTSNNGYTYANKYTKAVVTTNNGSNLNAEAAQANNEAVVAKNNIETVTSGQTI